MTQPRDNTGKEELVEEIVDYVHRVLLNTERASSLRLDRHDPEAQGKRLRTDAEDAVGYLITLISQAIERGDIPLTKVPPELPDEVGRGKGYADTKGYDSGFAGQADVELIIDEHTVRPSQVYDGGRLEFIALSPAERKEEEK